MQSLLDTVNDCCVELVDKSQKCVAVMDYWEGKYVNSFIFVPNVSVLTTPILQLHYWTTHTHIYCQVYSGD
jgi:hypothetical protein